MKYLSTGTKYRLKILGKPNRLVITPSTKIFAYDKIAWHRRAFILAIKIFDRIDKVLGHFLKISEHFLAGKNPNPADIRGTFRNKWCVSDLAMIH